MKARNAGIGMKVQVKHDCRGYCGATVKEGFVCPIKWIDEVADEGYELCLVHPDIDGGFAWVNASDVRRYVEPTASPEPIEPQDDIKVGDSVLVGAEGAGNHLVRKEYAGLVCSVVDTSHHDDCVEISHPDVMGGTSYTSRKEYLTKVEPKPVRPDLSSLRVGDYIVANDTDPHLQEGVAYRVVRAGSHTIKIALHHSDRAIWRAGYWVTIERVAKILREVNDATPRVVKLGSESTCRSE